MIEKNEYAVVLVYTISHAIRIEGMLKKNGVAAKLIPVPRHLSSDCGSAVRIPATEKGRCEQVIRDGKVEYQEIVDLER